MFIVQASSTCVKRDPVGILSRGENTNTPAFPPPIMMGVTSKSKARALHTLRAMCFFRKAEVDDGEKRWASPLDMRLAVGSSFNEQRACRPGPVPQDELFAL